MKLLGKSLSIPSDYIINWSLHHRVISIGKGSFRPVLWNCNRKLVDDDIDIDNFISCNMNGLLRLNIMCNETIEIEYFK